MSDLEIKTVKVGANFELLPISNKTSGKNDPNFQNKFQQFSNLQHSVVENFGQFFILISSSLFN